MFIYCFGVYVSSPSPSGTAVYLFQQRGFVGTWEIWNAHIYSSWVTRDYNSYLLSRAKTRGFSWMYGSTSSRLRPFNNNRHLPQNEDKADNGMASYCALFNCLSISATRLDINSMHTPASEPKISCTQLKYNNSIVQNHINFFFTTFFSFQSPYIT